MRTNLRIAIVAASALLVAAPTATADAATGHVLTIRTAGGTAVKTGAVLKAGLAKGTAVVFTLSGETLTCKSSSFTAKVTSNPAKPGRAKESLTGETVRKCTVNVQGVTVSSVKVSNLPFLITVSDAKGHPVKVSGRSKAKPLLTTVSVKDGSLVVTCSYKAASITGHESNTGSVITFVKQKFTKAGGGVFCVSSAFFSGSFGPVRDSSVHGSPRIFVN